ncbi:MAG: T9SS type A sorting domain-containing protein [Bacteroidales bacterium]|nr:T9SS type A sorting domain-containing protein [Bacteroidales bacterium]
MKKLLCLSLIIMLTGNFWLIKGQTYDHTYLPKIDPSNPLKFKLYVPEEVDTVKGICFYLRGGKMDGIGWWNKDFIKKHRSYYASRNFAFLMADMQNDVFFSIHHDTIKSWVGDAVFSSIAALADSSDHPEIEHSPLFMYGHSNGGFFSTHFAMNYAERILGFVACKGAGWFAIDDSVKQKALDVPGIIIIGEQDPVVRPTGLTASFNESRTKGGLWAKALQKGGNHNRVTDTSLIFTFFREVVEQRLHDSVHFDTIPALKPLTHENAWLADNSTNEIAPFSCFNRDKSHSSWFPGELSAKAWQKYVSNGKTNDVISCNDSTLYKPYFDQEKPGIIPEKFAPGIVSIDGRIDLKYDERFDNRKALLSSVTYQSWDHRWNQFELSHNDTLWSIPQPIDSLANTDMFLGVYAPDGNSIFVYDTNFTVWQSKITMDTNWQAREYLVADSNIYDISFTSDSLAYYKSNEPKEGLYKAKYRNDSLFDSQWVDIQTDGEQYYISKDESYMLYTRHNNIYVSFNQGNNVWSEGIYLGEDINTSRFELFPTVSADGEHIFFSRSNKYYSSYDIYWVDSDIIGMAKNNVKPVIDLPMDDVLVYTDSVKNIVIPDEFASDTNSIDSVLKYIAMSSDGKSLPSWIKFNSFTKTFNISKSTPDSAEILVRALDYFNYYEDDTFKVTVVPHPSGINSIAQEKNLFTVHPNPARDWLTITSSNQIFEHASIELITITGKIIRKELLTSVENHIDVSDLRRGMYLVRIHFDEHTELHKLIISN